MVSHTPGMRHFEVDTLIHADPERVWRVLVHHRSWPHWDGSIERVEGQLAEGGSATLYTRASPRPFHLKVSHFDEPSRMVLTGGLPFGLFTGRRIYELAAEQGGTRFRMQELLTGLLAPLIARGIPDLQPSFESFAEGLRRTAESAPRTTEEESGHGR